MKNPDDMRLVIAAVTLWILRFAQNDSFHFDHSICTFALEKRQLGTKAWNKTRPVASSRWNRSKISFLLCSLLRK